MSTSLSPLPSNRDLRDDIRDYWSDRAAGFDLDAGHKIADGAERRAWAALITRHLGPAEGRALLDLASGTGEIALLCHELGFRVTGLDWAEPMLDRARAKAQGTGVRFLQADAERTMLPDASQQAIITRHLVWTLVDPEAAFAEWFRLLAPGGRLMVVDGDWVNKSWLSRLLGRLAPSPHARMDAGMLARHAEIIARVHFRHGARADRVAAMLVAAGFTDLRIETRLTEVHRAQAALFGWKKALMRRSEHRYVISAAKPV